MIEVTAKEFVHSRKIIHRDAGQHDVSCRKASFAGMRLTACLRWPHEAEDIKPSNFVIGSGDGQDDKASVFVLIWVGNVLAVQHEGARLQVYIVDFGLAKRHLSRHKWCFLPRGLFVLAR